MNEFDEIRRAYPHLGLAVYAYAPGEPVVLEVLFDGVSLTFAAGTLPEAFALAGLHAPVAAEQTTTEEEDVFS